MEQFGQEVVNNTAPTLLGHLLKELELLSNSGHNVEDMAEALSQLRASRNDLRDAIELSLQQTRPEQVQNWFNRVKEAEAKVEKIQQDYSNRCLCAGSFSPNIFSSYVISRRAVQWHENVKKLLREHDTLKNLTVERPHASCVARNLPTPIVGKKSYLAQVLACIDDDTSCIVSICGMAGVGKTALLGCVNNQFLPGAERGDALKLVIWVDNASSDVKNIQDQIAQRLRLEDLGDDAEPERRASRIFSFLKNTSFLVLLDNLTNPVSLTDIGIPNPKSRPCSYKQKVVLTTRLKGVCARMGSCRRIDVECLDQDESWKLLMATAGDGLLLKDKQIEGFARQIARECGGLPIAMTKIVGAMATNRQPGDWRRTVDFLQKSQIHRIPGMERENTAVLQHLKKSYEQGLSSPTHRECFLCCALWPRGQSISKADIIDCWIGLGLIREISPDETVRTGFSIISCLQEANLLLPGANARDEVKMQPVVRDMALWIACDCGKNDNKCLVQAGVQLGARHKLVELCQRAAAAEKVSLMYNSIHELPHSQHLTLSCPNLAVLMLQHNNTLTHIPGAFFRSAPALAYLDLSHTAIEELPEDIGTLVMLQYLNLSFTLLKTLPVGLQNLSRLKHLLLRHTNHLSTIPVGIFRSLTSLQAIDMYPSRYTDWENSGAGEGDGNEGIASFEQMSSAFIQFLGITITAFGAAQRLGRLTNVCTRRLLLTNFSSHPCVTLCPSRFKVWMNSFSLLETLLELSIAECSTLEQLVFDGEEDDEKFSKKKKEDDERRRNESWCLPKLENLELRGLSKLAAIIWKGMSVSFFLPVLQSVNIENCKCLGNVGWVIRLPWLQHLKLRNCTALTSIVEDHELQDVEDDQPPSFSSLKTLILENLTELRTICSPQVSFPRLEVVEVGGCANLKRLHIEPQGKLREIRGTMEWWHGLEWDTNSNIQASLYPYFFNTGAQ